MRITVITSNQPRHLALIEALAERCTRVYAVQECNTVFPGTRDDFFRKSDVMQAYFARVLAAERRVFGGPRLTSGNVQTLAVKMGDLRDLPIEALCEALTADYFVVFGASYIRGPLCDALVERGAVNLHMGVSPYYRGSSTNFWALYDGRPELVGATIHLLTRGLDSGPILMHAFPETAAWEPFELGMRAVQSAQQALVERLCDGTLLESTALPQDKRLQMRYTRNSDFTDAVAAEYLARLASTRQIEAALKSRDLDCFVRPAIGGAVGVATR